MRVRKTQTGSQDCLSLAGNHCKPTSTCCHMARHTQVSTIWCSPCSLSGAAPDRSVSTSVLSVCSFMNLPSRTRTGIAARRHAVTALAYMCTPHAPCAMPGSGTQVNFACSASPGHLSGTMSRQRLQYPVCLPVRGVHPHFHIISVLRTSWHC